MQNKILVIGDTILDEYIYVDPRKISDEAHVITSNVINKKYVLGGATNVARNISSLGGECTYIGLTSKLVDSKLRACMQEFNIHPILFMTDDCVQTKTRIMSTRGAQICRFDSIINDNLLLANNKKIVDYVKNHVKEFNIIVISKYYDFFLTKDLVSKVLKIAKNSNVQVIVDNRQANIEIFKDVGFYKVNFAEFCALYTSAKISNTFESIKNTIKKHGMKVECMLITRSSLPTIVCKKEKNEFIFEEIPVEEVKVKDVSGAGDTFVAAFVVNYYSKLTTINAIKNIIDICHKVCNIVVRKVGTSVVWTYEFNTDVPLKLLCEQLKKSEKRIVFTNGVFDVLHSGHIRLLEEAKSFGDYLIVGLNSDESVRLIKGPSRPINEEKERKYVLEALRYVDHVHIFTEKNVEKLLEVIKPDTYVKGGDYSLATLPEKNAVECCGSIKFIKFMDGKSTTNIINKIKNSKNV